MGRSYFLITFCMSCLIGLLPFFRQTKKNLMWFVLVIMFTSAFLIIDLGVEFLAFAYLIIYIGAIAVMFLFVIVTVDPKFENQKDTFEKTVIPALTLNNFLTFIIYFFISSSNMASGPYDHNNFYLWKNEIVNFFSKHDSALLFLRRHFFYHYKIERIGESRYYIWKDWFKDDLSLYNHLEYRLKDINLFANNFFNEHGLLLIIIGFILTLAMIVSVIIAKDFSNKN